MIFEVASGDLSPQGTQKTHAGLRKGPQRVGVAHGVGTGTPQSWCEAVAEEWGRRGLGVCCGHPRGVGDRTALRMRRV